MNLKNFFKSLSLSYSVKPKKHMKTIREWDFNMSVNTEYMRSCLYRVWCSKLYMENPSSLRGKSRLYDENWWIFVHWVFTSILGLPLDNGTWWHVSHLRYTLIIIDGWVKIYKIYPFNIFTFGVFTCASNFQIFMVAGIDLLSNRSIRTGCMRSWREYESRIISGWHSTRFRAKANLNYSCCYFLCLLPTLPCTFWI